MGGPPTAAELTQLKKLITSSVGNDGTPRLDSVSLYSLGKLLGKGAFGAVKMGVHKLSGAVVAIKNFKKADIKNDVEARSPTLRRSRPHAVGCSLLPASPELTPTVPLRTA